MLICVNCTRCHRVCVCVCLCVCAHTYLFEYVHVFSFCVLCFRYINERENTIVMEGCMLMNKSPTVMCSAKQKKQKKVSVSMSLWETESLLSQPVSKEFALWRFCILLYIFFVCCCYFCFVVVVFCLWGDWGDISQASQSYICIFFIHFLRD